MFDSTRRCFINQLLHHEHNRAEKMWISYVAGYNFADDLLKRYCPEDKFSVPACEVTFVSVYLKRYTSSTLMEILCSLDLNVKFDCSVIDKYFIDKRDTVLIKSLSINNTQAYFY